MKKCFIKISEVFICIDSEIGCVKSGNTLTPPEQDIAISVAENIKRRIKGCKIEGLK